MSISFSHMFSQQEFNKWKRNGWMVGDIGSTDAPSIGLVDGAASYHQDRLTVSLYFVNTVNQKLICMYKAV